MPRPSGITHCSCGSPMFSVQHIGSGQQFWECGGCHYRVPMPYSLSPFSELPVEYRFSVPRDCAEDVKHALLAGAGHMYCWKCGVGITEESSVPNPPWPVGRALQRLMRSSLQLLPHINMYSGNPPTHFHMQEIKEAVSEIERLTGLTP